MRYKQPPDTEKRNTKTADLSSLSAAGILAKINAEDALAAAAVKKASKEIEKAVVKTAELFKKGGNIIFTGAGTSGRLGIIEAAECPPTFGTAPSRIRGVIAGGKNAVFKSKEGAEDDAAQGAKDILKLCQKGDIVYGIAASGRTPYVLGSLKAAKKKGCATALVCCAPAGNKAADIIIYLPVGPEALQGSTRMKAGTATKMALNMITTASMTLCGKVYKNYMADVKATNAKLRLRAERIVSEISGITPGKARGILKETKYNVKQSIVMAVKKTDKKTAGALLKKADGFLQKILDEK